MSTGQLISICRSAYLVDVDLLLDTDIPDILDTAPTTAQQSKPRAANPRVLQRTERVLEEGPAAVGVALKYQHLGGCPQPCVHPSNSKMSKEASIEWPRRRGRPPLQVQRLRRPALQWAQREAICKPSIRASPFFIIRSALQAKSSWSRASSIAFSKGSRK